MHEQDYLAGNPAIAESGRAFVLTGCSGAGKSTLLAELGRRGYGVVPEAGRQIVKEANHLGLGLGLTPHDDPVGFAVRLVWRAVGQYNAVRPCRLPVFFDRSIVEGLNWIEMHGLTVPAEVERAATLYRYTSPVFVAPPWPDLFAADPERRHGFDDAVGEYRALTGCYRRLGYDLLELPLATVAERASFVQAALGPL